MYLSWTSAVLAKSFLTPIERAKIVLQVNHLANYTTFTKPRGSLNVFGSKF